MLQLSTMFWVLEIQPRASWLHGFWRLLRCRACIFLSCIFVLAACATEAGQSAPGSSGEPEAAISVASAEAIARRALRARGIDLAKMSAVVTRNGDWTIMLGVKKDVDGKWLPMNAVALTTDGWVKCWPKPDCNVEKPFTPDQIAIEIGNGTYVTAITEEAAIRIAWAVLGGEGDVPADIDALITPPNEWFVYFVPTAAIKSGNPFSDPNVLHYAPTVAISPDGSKVKIYLGP